MPRFTVNGKLRSFASKSCELKTRWRNPEYHEARDRDVETYWASPGARDEQGARLNAWWDAHPEEREARAMRLWGPFKAKLESGYRTPGEASIETALIALGISYNFEHQIGRYYVDFALPDLHVALECDGNFHRIEANRSHDAKRDAWLESQGWRVVRISHDKALTQSIANHLRALLLP